MEQEYGQVAYEAYAFTTGNKSLVSGAELPGWSKLDPRIQQAWNVAAASAIDAARQNGDV